MSRPFKIAPKKKKMAPAKRKAIKWSDITIGDIGSLLGEAAGATRRLLNAEVKRFDTAVYGFQPGTGGQVVNLSLIGQGDDYDDRDGLSLRTLSLEGRLSATAYTAAATKDIVRFILVCDQENSGSPPAVADVLEAVSTVSAFNHVNLERFVVLHDELIDLSTDHQTVQHRVLKMPLDTHIRYSGTTALAASQRENNLYAVFVCDENTNKSTLSFYTRVSFVDN